MPASCDFVVDGRTEVPGGEDDVTTTGGNKKSVSCAFPECNLKVNGYGQAGDRYCSIHSRRDFQAAVGVLEALQAENQRLRTLVEKAAHAALSAAPRLMFRLISPGSIRIENRGQERVFVEVRGNRPRLVLPEREQDLFMRFAELSRENEQAHRAFAENYGLLGLRGAAGGDREERIADFARFQTSFKEAFSMAQARLEGQDVDDKAITDWLSENLRNHVNVLSDSAGHLTLYARTLAGALTLQLYRFVLLGKVPNRCLLPGCNLHTTRRKFCSEKHRKLFHTWKLRGKIEEVDGVWQQLDPAGGDTLSQELLSEARKRGIDIELLT